MNFKRQFLLAGFVLLISILPKANVGMISIASLSGKITDKQTGLPIPGAIIYLPDLKAAASSRSDGTYTLTSLPARIVLVQVTFTGYKMIAMAIDLSLTTTIDFAMEEAINELHEVVVTGLTTATEHNRTPNPIAVIPAVELTRDASNSIMDAVARQPGISQVTTGTGISKPVIRGLGYNRVITVIDGIRQEGQQWGDEHGIEVDGYAVERVEIIKGPASLSYGSDAMAGVIHLLSAPNVSDGMIRGSMQTNFQTNNGLLGYSANIAGNHHGFVWDTRYSNRRAHAYQNSNDGFVLNSGFRENAIRLMAGLNNSWGYTHLHVSAYHMIPGIVEGERDSATGKFVKVIALNDTLERMEIASRKDMLSYKALVPYQDIHHYKAVLNSSVIAGNGTIKATLGWQQNERREFTDVHQPGRFRLAFDLNTINYDLQYQFANKNDLMVSAGVNGMYQIAQNTGSEFLIPEYDLFDKGLYILAKKEIDRADVSAGIRYDSRAESGQAMFLNEKGEIVSPEFPNAFQQFSAFTSTYSGISCTMGAAYQFSAVTYGKLNLARGFRAPNIIEISSNGVHEGSNMYTIGDPALKAEHSWQVDVAMGVQSDHIRAALELFHNHIDNLIFLSKLESAFGGDSLQDGVSTFKYVPGKANIAGGEVSFNIHPHTWDWLALESSFSYVLSRQPGQPDSMQYLPFTPHPKWSTAIQATIDKVGKGLGNLVFRMGLEGYLRQHHIYSAFNTETETPGYILVNLSAGLDIMNKHIPFCSIYLNANNLLDAAYQDHLSRLKFAPVNPVTGRTGVYNMGRNVSIKLILPFTMKYE